MQSGPKRSATPARPSACPQSGGSPSASHPSRSHPLRSHSHWDRAAPADSDDADSCDRPRAAGAEGDTVRKAIFELMLAWQLTFGGSGSLLRRV
ncbi:hypothetical protein GCM10009869_18060 [Amnibacterium kyonggiense]